ncbi:MAG: hypothetical protein AB1649_24450 [Chloroflexota bacterium]
MGISPQKQMDEAAAILLAFGYVLFFCVACTAAFILYSLYYAPPIGPTPIAVSTIPNPVATSLPPRTPIPHISFTEILDAEIIIEDDFADNDNGWWSDGDNEYGVQIKDGELILQSQYEGNYSITRCADCYLEEPYFLQLDLRTTTATDISYGIIFNGNYIQSMFSLLEINVASQQYFVYHHSGDGWLTRVIGKSTQIKPFPEVNTFGLYLNESVMELYINGNLVDTYVESGASLHEGYLGLYVNGAGFKLLADNLTVRKAGN